MSELPVILVRAQLPNGFQGLPSLLSRSFRVRELGAVEQSADVILPRVQLAVGLLSIQEPAGGANSSSRPSAEVLWEPYLLRLRGLSQRFQRCLALALVGSPGSWETFFQLQLRLPAEPTVLLVTDVTACASVLLEVNRSGEHAAQRLQQEQEVEALGCSPTQILPQLLPSSIGIPPSEIDSLLTTFGSLLALSRATTVDLQDYAGTTSTALVTRFFDQRLGGDI
eukprot:RCo029990